MKVRKSVIPHLFILVIIYGENDLLGKDINIIPIIHLISFNTG